MKKLPLMMDYKMMPHGFRYYFQRSNYHQMERNVRKRRLTASDRIVLSGTFCHTVCFEAKANNPWTSYRLHFKEAMADSIIMVIKQKYNGCKGFMQGNDSRRKERHQ